MRKKKVIRAVLIIVIIAITILTIYIIQKNNRKKVQEEIIQNWINEEENIIAEGEIVETFSDNAIGKLKIPILNIDAEIAEGTSLEVLSNYIGHFENSGLWDGNVALASHNRGQNVAHYFENINKLQEGDLIVYITRWGERKYIVKSITKIKETDWSVVDDSDNNMITLITCVKNDKDKRLCVKAVEI